MCGARWPNLWWSKFTLKGNMDTNRAVWLHDLLIPVNTNALNTLELEKVTKIDIGLL